MYFKSIEMTGFKSFVDNTTITFGSGITAIVGPNGCGKSNISDGIRWVLGEQRPKLLRGAKMEDFIFSGSTARKQAGMAEVSITLADVAGKLSRPELADYNEVKVSRRLYRSGESEYLINKTPCRLKDIVDLFLDTGISSRAFSIIEQDQIQRIVTSKPEDRRFIIEEAAGIMKYKHRRHQALNKLEGSKANLARVSDIINELERQKSSLKRQANKAERFKTFKTEIDELFLATSSDELRNLRGLGLSIENEINRLEEVRASLDTDISARKNELIVIQSSLDEKSSELSALKEEEFRISSTIEGNESKISMFTAQIEESSLFVERLKEEILSLENRKRDLEAEFTAKSSFIVERDSKVEEKSRELEEKRLKFESAQEEIEKIESQISSMEAEKAEILSLKAQKGNQLAASKTRIEMLENRREKIRQEKADAEISISEINRKKESKEDGISIAQGKLDILIGEVNELENRRRKLLTSKAEKENKISELKTAVTEIGTRLESLREVDNSLEGYQDGIRSLLQLGTENSEVSSRLKGALVDRISVEKRFETAIETLLGHQLEALLVENGEDAFPAIELLHSKKMGRATFLAMKTNSQPHYVDLSGIRNIPGYIGTAADLVKTDEELKPLISRLLSGVLFVEDLKPALISQGENLTLVTPQGDISDPNGVISGGTSGNNSGGMLERKRNIDELALSLEEKRKALEAVQAEFENLKSELEIVENGKEEKEALLKKEELNLVHERRDCESLAAELERHKTRLETFTVELDTLGIEADNLNSEIAAMEKEIEGLTERKNASELSLEQLETSEADSKKIFGELSRDISSVEIELTSIRGELNMAKSEMESIGNTVSEIGDRSEKMKLEIETNSEKGVRLAKDIELLKKETHNGLARRHELSEKGRAITEMIQEFRAEIEKKDFEVKKSVASMELAKESLGEAKIKNSETAVRISGLLEKIEEHGKTVEEVEMFDTAGLDMDECGRRMAELRSQLSKIGDVNLSAIEDYNQVSERLSFLTTQRDDLVESIEDIRKVIEKLNRTTKQLFSEAFEKISANFRVVFKRLFNGGEAEMILTDETNLLESGIEIMAMPPGKKRQNLTLLSAGEKAMTALSVLFSVFMVMPSPFCLLDEVDAPLDEANIGRFKEILLDFSNTTQFLVITHNQKTMAFADRLYGITMQQPGISQILSVDVVHSDTVIPEELTAVSG